jgi:hypothetical protein
VCPLLEPFTDDLWTASSKQRFWGLECGTRTTVVRLESGGLFVHCPAALTPALERELFALGHVESVVAPSLFHHLYVGQWMDAYPEATFWACPGLERKRSDLAWTGVLGDTPAESWKREVAQAAFTARFENEIVFFHDRTRTLICADALLNLSTHSSRSTRAVAFLMGNTAPGKGYLERIAVRDYRLGRRQVDRMAEWDIDKITLAHGSPVTGNGRRVLLDAYAWL